MKIQQFLLAGIVTLGSVGSAMACSCNGTDQLKNGALSTALSNNTVCVPSAGGGWEFQEQHIGVGNGSLVDYKRGPSDPVDPTETLGTWAVTGTGANTVVTYNYGSGGVYVFNVCQSGSSIGFCPSGTATPTVNGTLKTGTGGGC